jgi:hypothetical protein
VVVHPVCLSTVLSAQSVRRLREAGARKLGHMTVRAVVFDIGGVLEKVGPLMAWLGRCWSSCYRSLTSCVR